MKQTKTYKRIVCEDGFSVSIQANATSYCSPREDNAYKYDTLELGFPSAPDSFILQYAEDENQLTSTVYGYVPVNDVYLLMIKHGGVIEGEVPKGVPVYGGLSFSVATDKITEETKKLSLST